MFTRCIMQLGLDAADCRSDRADRDSLVRFVYERGVVEPGHSNLARVMQRHDLPVVLLEHGAARAATFRRGPIMNAPFVASQHDVVVDRERQAAPARISDHVQPRRFLTDIVDRKSTRLNSSHTVISYAV